MLGFTQDWGQVRSHFHFFVRGLKAFWEDLFDEVHKCCLKLSIDVHKPPDGQLSAEFNSACELLNSIQQITKTLKVSRVEFGIKFSSLDDLLH